MSRTELQELAVWSLWQSRLRPYRDLSSGDQLWTVEKHSGYRRLAWRTQVHKVVALPYTSLGYAAEIVEDVFGVPHRDFLNHPYTAGKRDSDGFLLAARFAPVTRINLPLPTEIRLDQMGWTSLSGISEHELIRLGLMKRS